MTAVRLHAMIASEDFKGAKCSAMGCESCDLTWNDLDQAICDEAAPCPGCGGTCTGPLWSPAERCANCGTMDWTLPQGRYCSRRCALQGEYAESLQRAAEPSAEVVPLSRSRLRGAAR